MRTAEPCGRLNHADGWTRLPAGAIDKRKKKKELIIKEKKDFIIMKLLALSNYIDDDRCSEEWCDGVEGYDAVVARENAHKVGQHGGGSPCEDGGRQEVSMVFGAKDKACDVWHRQSDKSHRSAESGGDGSK